MAKWKYRGEAPSDKVSGYDKMRKTNKVGKKLDEREKFVKSEKKWPKGDTYFAARVVEVHKKYAFVSPEPELSNINTRDVWLATVARRYLQSKRAQRNTIAVGDRVLCRPTGEKETTVETDLPCCVIENLAPRKSRIARLDPISPAREHVLAANPDRLVIVASFLSPTVKWGLIDRYLVLAEEEDIDATIILNKLDLLEAEASEEEKSKCEQEIKTYRDLGYETHVVSLEDSSQRQSLIDNLGPIFENQVSVVSGHSGVGKSSLVNLFDPEIVQEVEPNSDIFYKGRHTTTYASMIKLNNNGYVIDTPGIRSFLLDEKSSIQLTHGFRELRPHMGKCKFRECRHIDEPECSVLDALERGEISERRYKSYLGLLLRNTGREGRTRDEE